jgi:hypothetical protein
MPIMGENLLSSTADIPDRAAFARFIIALAENLRDKPEDWVRTDLEEYLRAMAFWLVNGLDAFNQNIRKQSTPDPPNWRLFADIMSAARIIDD